VACKYHETAIMMNQQEYIPDLSSRGVGVGRPVVLRTSFEHKWSFALVSSLVSSLRLPEPERRLLDP
jgi:hypothetical protein